MKGFEPMKKIFSSKSAILGLTLSTRIILAVAKFIAFFFTGFLFLLGEALNNTTDIVVVLATLTGVKYGEKGGDLQHPFGHRRLESVISLIVAVVFISVTSFQLLKTAVPNLFDPPPLTGNPVIAVYVLSGSFLLNLLPLPLLLRKENRQDISLKTELLDTINDGLSLFASMTGLALIYFGFPLGDPIATIIIALIIAFDAFLLIRENMNMLMGQSPNPEFYDEIKKIVLSHGEVRGIHDMIGEYIGPDSVHLDFDLELDPSLTLEESDKIVSEIKKMLRENCSKHVTVTIHPCSHQGDKRKIHSQI